VLLCAPAQCWRDQIGPTCMFSTPAACINPRHRRLRGVADGEIYKVINNRQPGGALQGLPFIHVGMQLASSSSRSRVPIAHYRDKARLPPFEWGRARELPAKGPGPSSRPCPRTSGCRCRRDYLRHPPLRRATAKIGHQIVINGFSYNPATKEGPPFHIVNSWARACRSSIIPVRAGRDERNILMEQSLSAEGPSPPEQAGQDHRRAPSPLLKPVGQAETSTPSRTNPSARRKVDGGLRGGREANSWEQDTGGGMTSTPLFGENVIETYDFIYYNAGPQGARDNRRGGRALWADLFRVPSTVALPHVDLEVKSSLGPTSIFIRTAPPQKVVKIMANTTAEGARPGAARMAARQES